MYSSSLMWAIMLVLSTSHILAYYVSSDCGEEDSPELEQLNTHIAEAFRRVDLVSKELKKLGTKEIPGWNEDIDNAAQLLVDESNYKSIADSMATLFERSSFNSGPIPGEGSGRRRNGRNEDIYFYCTSNRFNSTIIERGGELWHHNKEDNTLLPRADYYECFVEPISSALTLYDEGLPDEITLCDWYLPWFLDEKVRPGVMQCDWLSRIWTNLEETEELPLRFDRTPADLTHGLASTIMHELTHTTVYGSSDDITGPDYSPYGWVNCVKMKNYNNADSLAFLGTMAANIINCGMKPTHNGGMVGVKDWSPPR